MGDRRSKRDLKPRLLPNWRLKLGLNLRQIWRGFSLLFIKFNPALFLHFYPQIYRRFSNKIRSNLTENPPNSIKLPFKFCYNRLKLKGEI